MNSYFYLGFEPSQSASNLIRALEKYSGINKVQVYVLNAPLVDSKYSYDLESAAIVLVPKHKIMILNFGDNQDSFENFAEDLIEDLASISDKYNYKEIVGRVRNWRNDLVYISDDSYDVEKIGIKDLLKSNELLSDFDRKKSELLISLLTGSINDVDRIKNDIPESLLDKIKQKIQLFDGDQTRFVYSKSSKSKITIQGLSGTGKTELLLHKLKEIYMGDSSSKVMFTCHNRILASSLKTRIPNFFNFMKVEQQIEWNKRLWCEHAWGSQKEPDSGAYRFICHTYDIPFRAYNRAMPFSKACKLALDEIGDKVGSYGYAFDYMLIDESQDLPIEFIDLCQLVTKKAIYVAGDIFQSIFDQNVVNEVTPDYLLSKCYRTDPRTLMFSHGIGMGLFEDEKLRWLSDKEWEQCGYTINKDNGFYLLKRDPLRRFEDLNSQNIISMHVVKTNYSSKELYPESGVISIIKKIKNENSTVSPDDIGIIFIGSNKFGYSLADSLEYSLKSEFNWTVNKAYETKRSQPNTIFISNQNNVKGLEFPFVICIVDYISDQKHERNAIYMALTRSFIQSYLLVNDSYQQYKLSKIEDGLNLINENGYMLVTPPPKEVMQKISAKIEFDGPEQSVYDLVYMVFDDLDVPPICRDPLFNLIKAMKQEDIDYDSVMNLVSTNLEIMNFSK